MLNKEEFIQKISNIINDETVSVHVYFILEVENELIKRKVNITSSINDNTNEKIIKNSKFKIGEDLINNEDLNIISLSSSDERAKAIYYYDLEDVPQEVTIWKYEDGVEEIDYNSTDFSSVIGTIITLATVDEKLNLFKKNYPINILKQNDKNFLIKKKDRQFVSVKEDMLKISSAFDFIYLNDDLYIFDLEVLEKFANFKIIIEREALSSIEKIDSLNIVDNIETLEEELDNITFARKLAKIKRTSPVLTLEKQIILRFAQDEGLGIKILNDRFVLDTKKSKNSFIKLLNDDYLHSKLTGNDYEVKAKDIKQTE